MVNPQRLVWELSERLPANAIVAADSGSAANWYARHLSCGGRPTRLPVGHPGHHGSRGALRHWRQVRPSRPPSIALVGDGAMQMNGMAELVTIKRYWQEWSDPRLIVAVLHNNDLNQVTWEMRAMTGVPKFPASQDLPDISYASFAASIGLQAIEVREADEIGPAWDRALARRPSHGARCLYRSRRPAHPPARHPRSDARLGQSAVGRGRERLGSLQDRYSPKGPRVPARHQGDGARQSAIAPAADSGAAITYPHRPLRAEPGRAGRRRGA